MSKPAQPESAGAVDLTEEGKTSTLAVGSDRLQLDMPKSTLGLLIVLLLGGSLTGGAGVAIVSDARIDSRVENAIQNGIGKKFDEKMNAGLSAAREEAVNAAKASDQVRVSVEALQRTVIEQNARTNAQAAIDSNTRTQLEAMVRDHEARIREIERDLAARRR